VRRFFPQVPLAAVTLGPKVIGRLPALVPRRLAVGREVRGHEVQVTQGRLAEEVGEKLFRALPGLLALAHASRLLNTPPDTDLVRRRWSSGATGPLVQVLDAWEEFYLEGPDVPRQPWRKRQYGDVMLFSEPAGTGAEDLETALILFDTDPNDPKAPPLSDFGEAMARLTLNNPALGSLFARALEVFERGDSSAWERLLDRDGATPLVSLYTQRLAPLNDEEAGAFRTRLRGVLGSLGVELADSARPLDRLRHLRAKDLRPIDRAGWGTLSAADIVDALNNAGWTERERVFRPELTVVADNTAAWRSWLKDDGRSSRLDTFALHEKRAVGADDLTVERLRQEREDWLRREEFQRLDFSPEMAASRWLKQLLRPLPPAFDASCLEPASLDETLRNFAPRYQPVKMWTEAHALGWGLKPVAQTGTEWSERRPASTADYAQEDARRSAIGSEAEHALLAAVAIQTHAVLDNADRAGTLEKAWKVLLAAIPEGGQTHKALRGAQDDWLKTRDAEVLRNGLHISARWGNAGYDPLGLEPGEDGTPVAARYECKGLPPGAGPVRVFLSDNERRVGSLVRQGAAGFSSAAAGHRQPLSQHRRRRASPGFRGAGSASFGGPRDGTGPAGGGCAGVADRPFRAGAFSRDQGSRRHWEPRSSASRQRGSPVSRHAKSLNG
jgi:uncharacterized protein YecT (DUF1311 family)